jgi:hypothetical protein
MAISRQKIDKLSFSGSVYSSAVSWEGDEDVGGGEYWGWVCHCVMCILGLLNPATP